MQKKTSQMGSHLSWTLKNESNLLESIEAWPVDLLEKKKVLLKFLYVHAFYICISVRKNFLFYFQKLYASVHQHDQSLQSFEGLVGCCPPSPILNKLTII